MVKFVNNHMVLIDYCCMLPATSLLNHDYTERHEGYPKVPLQHRLMVRKTVPFYERPQVFPQKRSKMVPFTLYGPLK